MSDKAVSRPEGESDQPDRRLESWKEIAAYLGRDVRTVQRWERRDGLPVRRLHHSKLGSVFAYTSELDAWRETRDPTPVRSSAEGLTPVRWHRVWLAAGILTALVVFGLSRGRQRPAETASPAGSRIHSLAVLPLDDFAADRNQSYLAEGMTEALIGQLSALRDLRVISRTSVMQFKDTRTPVQEIARALGIDAVIAGSVLRSGNRVRVSAQLMQADTGEVLWSGTYDRDLGDVLTLQSEVAQAIAHQVRASVTPAERARLASTRTLAPEVYETYLKGLFNLNKGTDNAEASVAHFTEAIDRDPTFAAAFLGLALAYDAMGSTAAGVLPVTEARQKSVAAGSRALQIDPHLARAHAILGHGHQQEFRWKEAEAEYRLAIGMDPNDAVAHSRLAELLTWCGRTEEGIAYARLARELDPVSLSRTATLGWLLYHARQYDEAARELRTVLDVQPDHRAALWFLGFTLIDSSRLDEAIPILERLAVVWARNPAALGLLARAYGHAGRHTDALRIVDELKQRERVTYVPPAPFIHAYIGLGDRDRAFAALERAYHERSNIVQFLKTHPLYDPLRNDKRFADLLHRVDLEQCAGS